MWSVRINPCGSLLQPHASGLEHDALFIVVLEPIRAELSETEAFRRETGCLAATGGSERGHYRATTSRDPSPQTLPTHSFGAVFTRRLVRTLKGRLGGSGRFRTTALELKGGTLLHGPRLGVVISVWICPDALFPSWISARLP